MVICLFCDLSTSFSAVTCKTIETERPIITVDDVIKRHVFDVWCDFRQIDHINLAFGVTMVTVPRKADFCH
jgi:hypothetical protein